MRNLCGSRARLWSTVIVAGLIALLSLAPAVWAVPAHMAKSESGTQRALAWFGGWLDPLLTGMQSLWEAAGCSIDPNGAPCTSSTPTAEGQDGESCDSPTPQAGCSIDPDG